MWFRVALLAGALLTTPASALADDGPRVARIFGARHVEEAVLRLDDEGSRREALDELSVLARPAHVDRPTGDAIRSFREEHPDSPFVVAGIRRLDPGLLDRLAGLARRFPDRRIDIVSGYRPRSRATSRHHAGRALDVAIEGVAREDVVAFARTLPHTGVGYYPNSDFTHVDVRDESYYWIDRSGPGQRADYGPWPPRVVVAGTGTHTDRGTDTRTDADTAPDTATSPAAEPAPAAGTATAASTATRVGSVADAPADDDEDAPMNEREYRELRESIRRAFASRDAEH